MITSLDSILAKQLHRDEGERLVAYKDTMGFWTIGVGHNEQDDPTFRTVETEVEADQDLKNDIQKAIDGLNEKLPWWTDLDDPRQRVLVNMTFNMGISKLLGFKNTLKYIQDGDYQMASANMLMSAWATQVGERAQRLAQTMKTGVDVVPS